MKARKFGREDLEALIDGGQKAIENIATDITLRFVAPVPEIIPELLGVVARCPASDTSAASILKNAALMLQAMARGECHDPTCEGGLGDGCQCP